VSRASHRCQGCHIHARIAGYDPGQDADGVDGERAAGLDVAIFP
jgi:hypothetical protein